MMENDVNACLLLIGIIKAVQMQTFHFSIHGLLILQRRVLARWRSSAGEHAQCLRVHGHASIDGVVGDGCVCALEHQWANLTCAQEGENEPQKYVQ